MILLWFYTQFTRNSQITLLLELTFCREALGKKLFFAMWSLGRGQRRSGGNSGRGSPDPGRGGWGNVLWASRVRFGAWLVKKGRPAGAFRGSRRRRPLEQLLGAVGGSVGLWAGWWAVGRAEEGGGALGELADDSSRELAGGCTAWRRWTTWPAVGGSAHRGGGTNGSF
jgi:hypothetical protein